MTWINKVAKDIIPNVIAKLHNKDKCQQNSWHQKVAKKWRWYFYIKLDLIKT